MTVDLAVSPGGRPADASPIGTPGGRKNWVDQAGGLPRYIRMIAHALIRKGMTPQHAIATAVNRVRKLAAGSTNPKVKAAAMAAVAEWEAKKAKSHVSLAYADDPDALWVDLATLEDADAMLLLDLAPGNYRPPYDWKHGYIPITPAAALSKAKGNKKRASKLLRGGGKPSPRMAKQLEGARKSAPSAVAKAQDDVNRGRGVPGELAAAKKTAAGTSQTPGDTSEQQAVQRAKARGLGVGARVQTDVGPGTVKGNSSRGTTIELDEGDTINVATGTHGHDRLKPLSPAKKTAAPKPDKSSADPRLEQAHNVASDSLHRGGRPTQAERSQTSARVKAEVDKARAAGKPLAIVKHQDRVVGVNTKTGVVTPYGRPESVAPGDRERAGGIVDITGKTERPAVSSTGGSVSAPKGASKSASTGDGSPRLSGDTVRRMSDDQLDGALSRLMAAGGKDSHALSLIEKEMDRRDKAKAGGSPKGDTPGAGDTGLDDLTFKADRQSHRFTDDVVRRMSQDQLERSLGTLLSAGYDNDAPAVAEAHCRARG
jgi:hypothetical protein